MPGERHLHHEIPSQVELKEISSENILKLEHTERYINHTIRDRDNGETVKDYFFWSVGNVLIAKCKELDLITKTHIEDLDLKVPACNSSGGEVERGWFLLLARQPVYQNHQDPVRESVLKYKVKNG